MTKNTLKLVTIFIIGMVGGIFAEQIFWPYFIERPLFYKYNLDGNAPIYISETKEIFIQENTALTEAIEKTEKVVIAVNSKTSKGKIIQGSGLIVTSDGLIVTLADLVPRGAEFSFYVNNKKQSYQILKRDLEENLALVKLDIDNTSTLAFRDLNNLKLGERVYLIGEVFELTESLSKKSINEGIITSFDEDLIETNISEEDDMSGSILFDIEGKILGLSMVNNDGKIVTMPASKIAEFIGM